MELSDLFLRALLAYSIHEHQEGFVRRIDVLIGPDGFTVEDDGRGMGLHKAGYVENLMGTLAGGPGPVQLHGVGLSLVAASVPQLHVQARRGGQLHSQSFAWGVATGPVETVQGDARTGTRTRVVLAEGMAPPQAADLEPQLALWRQRHPALAVDLRDAS